MNVGMILAAQKVTKTPFSNLCGIDFVSKKCLIMDRRDGLTNLLIGILIIHHVEAIGPSLQKINNLLHHALRECIDSCLFETHLSPLHFHKRHSIPST